MGKTYEPTLGDIRSSSAIRLRPGQYGNVHTSGSLHTEGPCTLNALHTSGSCHAAGDLTAQTVGTSGSLHVAGSLQGGKIHTSGSLHVDSHLWADKVSTSGSTQVKGAIWGRDVGTSGSCHAAECDVTGRLHVSGSVGLQGDLRAQIVDVSGSLNARNVCADAVKLHAPARTECRELYGRKVEIVPFEARIFGISFRGNMTATPNVRIGTIQGDEITLEYVDADVVRGRRVTVGAHCHIKRLEAEHAEVDPAARIDQQEMCKVTLTQPALQWVYPCPEKDAHIPQMPDNMQQQSGAQEETVQEHAHTDAETHQEAHQEAQQDTGDMPQQGGMFGKKPSNLAISGIGTLWDGVYDRVEVSGMGKLTGKVKAAVCEINGTLRGSGELESGVCDVKGMVSIHGTLITNKTQNNGRLKVETLRCTDRLESNGSLYCERDAMLTEAESNGWMTVLGNVSASSLEAGPVLAVKGMLNADSVLVDCSMYGGAREVEGESITIGLLPERSNKANFRMGSVARALFSAKQAMKGYKMERFMAKSIEGTTVILDHVLADVVRGHHITIGAGCEIELVEYTGTLQQSDGAQVKRAVKV